MVAPHGRGKVANISFVMQEIYKLEMSFKLHSSALRILMMRRLLTLPEVLQ